MLNFCKICLSASLRLQCLNWALALRPRGRRLFPRNHEKYKNKGDEASKERNTHNQNPRCARKKKTLTVARGRRKSQSKSKTLASNLKKKKINPKPSICYNVLKNHLLTIESIEPLKNQRKRVRKRSVGGYLKPQSQRNGRPLGQQFDFSLFVHFLIFRSCSYHFQLKSTIFLCPMPREF